MSSNNQMRRHNMEYDNPIIYGLEFQTRALAAQLCESEKTRFIVGTQCITQANNQIHVLELNEKTDSLSAQIYHHKFGEILKIASSPFDSNILATCYNTISSSLDNERTCQMKTAYFKLGDSENDSLEKLVEFETEGCDIVTNEFHPQDRNKCAIVIDDHILFYDVGNGESHETNRITLEEKPNGKYINGKWYPHQNASQFIGIHDADVLCYDTRTNNTNKPVWRIKASVSNEYWLKDLDMNINRQGIIATVGDDAFLKLWDIRNVKEPVYARRDHSHWVWCVRFNIYHDQLILTSSSDAKVLLSNLQTDHNNIQKDQKLAEGPLQWYEQHEDSVYSVEWSRADPWTFASLSYDGRFVLNRIPKQLKYQILL